MLQQHSSLSSRGTRSNRRLESLICRLERQVLAQRCSYRSGPRRRNIQRVQVTCTALDQDTEVASTSGRHHADGVHIRGLFNGSDCNLASLTNHDPEEQPSTSSSEPPEWKQLNKKIKNASTLPHLLELIRTEGPNFNHINCTVALQRLTSLHQALFHHLHATYLASREAQAAAYAEYVQPSLTLLNQLVRKHAPHYDAWDMSLSIWAFGNMNQAEDETLAVLCQRGAQLLQHYQPIDCATVLVGLAKLETRPRCVREFVDHLLHHVLEILNPKEGWKSQELSNVLWSLSKLGAGRSRDKKVLLDALMHMVLWQLEDFNMQELSTVVYSYGRLRYRIPQGLQQIALRAAKHVQQLNSQDAAMLMYGFACLDYKPHPVLLDQLPLALMDRLNEFKPQEVSNLLYGYGHLKHQHAYLLDCVAKGCAPRLHEFSTQDMVLTIWSYGKVKYVPRDPACFINACCVLLTRKDQLLPIQIAIIVKGFALAGYSPPPAFMDQMAQAAIRKLQQFKPVEFAQLLWAYAKLGYRDVALFESVVAHSIYLLQSWSRPLPKTTVDTVVYSCQQVGFWPQALVDAAELRGIYVRNFSSQGEVQQGELIGELRPVGSMPMGWVPPTPQQQSVNTQQQQVAAGVMTTHHREPQQEQQQQQRRPPEVVGRRRPLWQQQPQETQQQQQEEGGGLEQ